MDTLERLSKSQSRALIVYVFYHVAYTALGGVFTSGGSGYRPFGFFVCRLRHACHYGDRPFELLIFPILVI